MQKNKTHKQWRNKNTTLENICKTQCISLSDMNNISRVKGRTDFNYENLFDMYCSNFTLLKC